MPQNKGYMKSSVLSCVQGFRAVAVILLTSSVIADTKTCAAEKAPADTIFSVADTAAVVSPTGSAIVIDDLVVKSIPVAKVTADNDAELMQEKETYAPPEAPKFDIDMAQSARDTVAIISGRPRTIYSKPVSWTYSDPWWHGLWINTAVYAGAFVGTLFVLEMLPEDATAWNRSEINSIPFYKRWYTNIFKKGPEWDHDLFIFNYVLHPYAGAAYFMSARTCGFNFWQSMLYSAFISNIGWEFGIEACMERPSYQDLVVTPVIGSLIGGGFYRLKRLIVENDYYLLNSRLLGHIAAFILDPLNEFIGLLSPEGSCRSLGPGCIQSQPLLIPNPAPGHSSAFGISLSATF